MVTKCYKTGYTWNVDRRFYDSTTTLHISYYAVGVDDGGGGGG